MIDKNNLKQALEIMGFKRGTTQQPNNPTTQQPNNPTTQQPNNPIYVKDYGRETSIKIDFDKEKIIYPSDLKINKQTTSNFSSPENFVVLECINRLLDKGYESQFIELEPSWKLGHTNKSGRADILVKYKNNKPYLLIECKTAGKEFQKEWDNMQNDGGQLFSYFQQQKDVKFLCLYCSDYKNNNITFMNKIIKASDNKEFLELNNKQDSYQKAGDAKALYRVWKESYEGDYSDSGIFNNNPYKILESSLKFEDLIELNTTIYNDFAKILRKHNISGKENAFDKLVNLFLCKIYDEANNKKNLAFGWRGNLADDYFQMQERLMNLYKNAMESFLGETISSVSKKDIDTAFQQLKGDFKALKKEIQEHIKTLKFYSNNDFAFLEVHNRELFIKNANVLKEIVELFAKYKLSNTQNQLLGNLFELFLESGIKQNEGQFFTPLQICEFICYSLPLEKMLEQKIKVIDYACGAGHFLNTYANELKHIISDESIRKEYYKNIYGIEKEYRLSKISKVSSAMQGQNEINIIFSDALASYELQHQIAKDSAPKPQINNHSFNLLIANPPYSVKGFLETLSKKSKESYSLFNSNIKQNTNNAIECFFIERAIQLLEDDGLAAIILPNSILSKDSIYAKTRELILCNFLIKAIVELPQATFGATGTTTVILFLQKLPRFKSSNKSQKYEMLNDAIESAIENKKIELLNGIYDDLDFIDSYQKYLKKQIDLENEREKLLYFALCFNQKTIIIKAPNDNALQKKFLGYEWSKRKGSEGLKELENPYNSPLYTRQNRNDNKLNKIIKNAFLNNYLSIPKELEKYAFVANLVDLIDFEKPDFNKAINLNISSNKQENSQNIFEGCKYGLVKIDEIIIESPKSKIQVKEAKENTSGKYPFYTSGINIYRYDEFLIDGENIYLSTGGNALVQFYNGKSAYSTDTYAIKTDSKKCLTRFLFYLLKIQQNYINGFLFKGAGLKHLQKQDFKNLQIPLPPLEIQSQIVSECEEIEAQFNTIKMSIEQYNELIREILIKAQIIQNGGGAS